MRLTRTMKINATAGAIVIAISSALVLTLNGAASADGTPPPWVPGGVNQDPNASGGLKFFNAAGTEITSGSTTAQPFAAFAVGLNELRAGDTKATLLGFLPTPGQTPDAWSTSEQIGLSTTYPNATAPSPIKNTALPVNTGGAGDESLGSLASHIVQTSTTAGYVNMYEIRMLSSAFGLGVGAKYDYADIAIDPVAHTWTRVFTPAGAFPPPTTTPPTTPTTPPTTPTTPPTTPTTPPTTPTTPPTTPTTPPTTPTTPPTTPTTPPTTPTTPPTTPTTPPTTPTTPPTTPTTPPTTPTTPPTTPTTPPTTPTTPVASTTTAGSGSVSAVDSSGTRLGTDPTLAPGSTTLVTASGFAPKAAVSITMHSTPLSLGTRTASASGSVSYSFTVPRGTAPGAHRLVFASSTESMSFAFTVSGAPTSASPTSLSATGDDVVTPTLYGILAVLLGATLMYTMRTRFLYRGRHG